jgi:hypothetical protein
MIICATAYLKRRYERPSVGWLTAKIRPKHNSPATLTVRMAVKDKGEIQNTIAA